MLNAEKLKLFLKKVKNKTREFALSIPIHYSYASMHTHTSFKECGLSWIWDYEGASNILLHSQKQTTQKNTLGQFSLTNLSLPLIFLVYSRFLFLANISLLCLKGPSNLTYALCPTVCITPLIELRACLASVMDMDVLLLPLVLHMNDGTVFRA